MRLNRIELSDGRQLVLEPGLKDKPDSMMPGTSRNDHLEKRRFRRVFEQLATLRSGRLTGSLPDRE